jgi:YYY domain-containing protein
LSAPEAALPLLFFALALLFAALGGAAVVARVFCDSRDDEGRTDVVLGLALPAGLLLAALPGWMLSAFSGLRVGTGEIVPVSIGRVVLPLAAIALLGALTLFGKDLLALLAAPRRTVLPVALFLAIFLGFVWLRFPAGEIRGTEKPMDLAVLSNLMTTTGIPLADPWMSGERFPYYYFGTFLFALPARAARLAPEIAYNLIAALLPAVTALALFAAVRSRGGKRKLAVFGALLCVLGGTPDGLRQWLSGQLLFEIDFWASSRRVLNAITEWPLFTFRLADLHPHAMALPILVAFTAVAGRVASLPGVFLDAVTAGAILSANPWDLPAVLLILAVGNLAERGLRPAVIRSATTLGIAAVVLVPFLRSPRPRLHGITFLPNATTALEAFLHFGALLAVPALAFGVALVRSKTRPDESLLFATLFPAAGILVAITTRRPALGLAAGFLLGVTWLLFRTRDDGAGAAAPPEGSLRAGFLFAGAGATLAVVADVLVVKDTYGDQLRRMNTIFKTWSDAWPLLCLGTALLLPVVLSARRARTAIRVLLLLALVASAIHPLSALAFRLRLDGGTLDGLAWMSSALPGDRLAAEWLRRHAGSDAVIAEATGNPYSDFGRIGVVSGRPTLLGWANHEGLWRAESGELEVRTRQNDLQTLYLSMDPPAVLDVIKRRKIEFIVLGPLELKVYGPNAFPARGGFRKVFEESGTALYGAGP